MFYKLQFSKNTFNTSLSKAYTWYICKSLYNFDLNYNEILSLTEYDHKVGI